MPDDTTLDVWRVPLERQVERPTPEKPPVSRVRVDRPHSGPSPTTKFTVHPRYRAWLARCGVTSADAALSLAGEVVSGHTDRHVVRVELRSGSGCRTAYLKREHVAGVKWRAKNWVAGFGWVSRCEREAATLSALEEGGFTGPQWLAHGEDANGRAFLLVDELAGKVDLLTLLRDRPPENAVSLSKRIGSTLAELHAAGFATPDLAAKHLLIEPDNHTVSVIDWPSAPKPNRVRDVDVVRWLGSLHAGIAPELASERDRLRVLWAYRRACRQLGRPVPYRFGFMAKAVSAAAARREHRPSVRAQRQIHDHQQRLVWVAGEAVVAIPEVAACWPTPAECEPYYPSAPITTPPHGKRERVILPSDRSAVLVRFQTTDLIGRAVACLRERPWRSPASTAARVLFHMQRHSIPAPILLAFGQRRTSPVAAQSFLCAEMPSSVVSIAAFLSHTDTTTARRAAVLAECGRLLRQLHDAGLRPTHTNSVNDPLFVVTNEDLLAVAVGSPFAVRVAKRLSQKARWADLNRLTQSLDRTAAGWVSGGYHGANG